MQAGRADATTSGDPVTAENFPPATPEHYLRLIAAGAGTIPPAEPLLPSRRRRGCKPTTATTRSTSGDEGRGSADARPAVTRPTITRSAETSAINSHLILRATSQPPYPPGAIRSPTAGAISNRTSSTVRQHQHNQHNQPQHSAAAVSTAAKITSRQARPVVQDANDGERLPSFITRRWSACAKQRTETAATTIRAAIVIRLHRRRRRHPRHLIALTCRAGGQGVSGNGHARRATLRLEVFSNPAAIPVRCVRSPRAARGASAGLQRRHQLALFSRRAGIAR